MTTIKGTAVKQRKVEIARNYCRELRKRVTRGVAAPPPPPDETTGMAWAPFTPTTCEDWISLHRGLGHGLTGLRNTAPPQKLAVNGDGCAALLLELGGMMPGTTRLEIVRFGGSALAPCYNLIVVDRALAFGQARPVSEPSGWHVDAFIVDLWTLLGTRTATNAGVWEDPEADRRVWVDRTETVHRGQAGGGKGVRDTLVDAAFTLLEIVNPTPRDHDAEDAARETYTVPSRIVGHWAWNAREGQSPQAYMAAGSNLTFGPFASGLRPGASIRRTADGHYFMSGSAR